MVWSRRENCRLLSAVFSPASCSARSRPEASRRNRSSVSERSAIRRVVTWPSRSTSRRTSMRPSSGGSRRISKRFLPAIAWPAISMATPASGTVTACAAGGAGVARFAGAGETSCDGGVSAACCTMSPAIFGAVAWASVMIGGGVSPAAWWVLAGTSSWGWVAACLSASPMAGAGLPSPCGVDAVLTDEFKSSACVPASACGAARLADLALGASAATIAAWTAPGAACETAADAACGIALGRCRGNPGGRRDRLNCASREIGRQCGWRRTVGWLALAHRFGVIADLGLLADLGISLHLAVAEGFAIDAGRNGAGRIAGIGGIGCISGTGGLGVAAGLRRFRVFGLGRWLGRILLRGACGLVGWRRLRLRGLWGGGLRAVVDQVFERRAIRMVGARRRPRWVRQRRHIRMCGLKIPLISDEAINIGKSWLFEEELTEPFHERPQAILPHGRDELIMQAALAEQRMDTSLGCAGL